MTTGFHFNPISDDERSLSFNYQNRSKLDPEFHSHVEYEIYYFHEGKCNYLIGDRIYSLEAGDLILMNGMTLHCAKVDKTAPYVRTILHFDPASVRPYSELLDTVDVLMPFTELKNFRLRLRGEAKNEAERILLQMSEFKKRGNALGDNRFMLAFIDYLHFIYEKCEEPMREKKEFPSEKERLAQKLVTLLDGSFTEDLHMEDIEDKMHVSRSYLSKVFKEVTGVTIFEYIYRRRVNEAKVMFLMNPSISVTEVCFSLGFKHVAHFSRLFKEQVGQSPEAYKKWSVGVK
jgi:AraC-like DNA-binding protein